MVDTGHSTDRRSVIRWIGAVGLTALSSVTAVAANEDEPFPIEPPEDDRSGDVSTTHPLEYSGVRDRVRRARAQDDPTEKYGPRLAEKLEASERDTYDLHVRTYGEPATIETKRYGRQIDGWAPTDDEVERLSEFGDIGYVPDLLSTKISMYDVDADDVSDVAALPFVLSVDFKPEPVDDPFEGGELVG